MVIPRARRVAAKGAIFIIFTFILFGCAGEQVKSVDAEQRGGLPAQATASKGSAAARAGGEEETVMCLCEQYTVKKGDTLWWIAKYKDIYNDPFLWPVIYEANKDIIKNPKLLYPGQELDIPRGGYTLEEIKKMRKRAGAKKPYLPEQQANLPMD
ncbi:MAG TPA: LysM peptidoglycan-binding domain-containing protein [Syntrophales bacterium]|nr:LysM peptidoglycan-binding domain-containing protein [Syntrophales bacterium]